MERARAVLSTANTSSGERKAIVERFGLRGIACEGERSGGTFVVDAMGANPPLVFRPTVSVCAERSAAFVLLLCRLRLSTSPLAVRLLLIPANSLQVGFGPESHHYAANAGLARR